MNRFILACVLIFSEFWFQFERTDIRELRDVRTRIDYRMAPIVHADDANGCMVELKGAAMFLSQSDANLQRVVMLDAVGGDCLPYRVKTIRLDTLELIEDRTCHVAFWIPDPCLPIPERLRLP